MKSKKLLEDLMSGLNLMLIKAYSQNSEDVVKITANYIELLNYILDDNNRDFDFILTSEVDPDYWKKQEQ